MKTEDLRQQATAWGAAFFGVADLAPARQAILEQGGDLVDGFPLAVSMGIRLPDAIVDQLPQRSQRAAAISYRQHAYEVINHRLDLLASQVGSWLQAAGYRALPVSSSQRVDSIRICGMFSHKLAAHLAGLGWIGKSCLLVTPKAGPRVRWISVLTTAPLQAAQTLLEDGCGGCQQCVEACPVRAFTGRAFHPDEPRSARFDASKCDSYFARMRQSDPDTAVCGMCLYICPYGRKKK